MFVDDSSVVGNEYAAVKLLSSGKRAHKRIDTECFALRTGMERHCRYNQRKDRQRRKAPARPILLSFH